MSNKVARIFSFRSFFDLFFDFQCPLCEEPADRGLLCTLCRTYLEPLRDPCPACGEPNTLDVRCGRCQRHPMPWTRARIAWPLDGATRFLIHRMKYHQDFAAARSLAHHWLADFKSETGIDALVPVPQHASKTRARGFNQADWLARYWGKRQRLPVWTGVTKTRPTAALEGQNRRERRNTLKDVFEVRQAPPSRVAIVDDVLTTGATAAELCRTLKKAGAREVELWTLARTPLGF